MKRVALVQVNDRFGPNKFLPLAVAYQWLAAAQDPWIAENCSLADVLIEKEDPETWVKNMQGQLDAVVMSSYVWNWQYNQSLAREIKRHWPLCRVIVGGPQVPNDDPDFVRSNPWCDVAILGENEGCLIDILRCDDLGTLPPRTGVITAWTQQAQMPQRSDLSNIPSPILTGFFDDVMARTEAKYGAVDSWHLTWETMRGCPYHCTFCDIGDDYWNKVKSFDMDRIRAEIQWMAQKKIEFVFVCDSNWGLFDRDIEITQMIIDSKLQTGYPAILDVTFAKNNPERVQDIVERDHRAGTDLLRGIGLSIQTFSPDVLTRISRFNMQDHKTHQALKFYHENHIPTWSEMIWPLPGETVDSFRSSLQKLLDLGQHGFLSVHPLVITHNAPMNRAEYIQEHGIQVQEVLLDQFWAEISYDDVVPERVLAVKATAHVDAREMIQGHLFAHWLVVLYYYGWAHYVMRWLHVDRGLAVTDLVQSWIDYWLERPHSWIAQEHRAVEQSLTGVFEQGRPWGRKIDHGGNVMWEYKSGTCVGIHHRRDQWNAWVQQWLADCHGPGLSDLSDLNTQLCADWRRQYPRTYRTQPRYALSLLGLPGPDIVIDHPDRMIQDDLSFVKKAYHLRRRNLYWRCTANNP